MKRELIIGVAVVIVVVVTLEIHFYASGGKPTPSSNCGAQGETLDFISTSTPNECCEGLDNVNTQDSVSVADKCYWSGTESGAPLSTCSDCGNGICEDVESVCGCSEDCVEKAQSDFNTVQDFCDDGYKQYCDSLPKGMELDLCNLCA